MRRFSLTIALLVVICSVGWKSSWLAPIQASVLLPASAVADIYGGACYADSTLDCPDNASSCTSTECVGVNCPDDTLQKSQSQASYPDAITTDSSGYSATKNLAVVNCTKSVICDGCFFFFNSGKDLCISNKNNAGAGSDTVTPTEADTNSAECGPPCPPPGGGPAAKGPQPDCAKVGPG